MKEISISGYDSKKGCVLNDSNNNHTILINMYQIYNILTIYINGITNDFDPKLSDTVF